jgi:hypothetical protein
VGNNPIRYNDPTGYCRADDNPDDCFTPGRQYSPSDFLDLSGYTTWERKILRELYDIGGEDAENGALYILNNNIHIEVGEEFHCTGNPYGLTPSCTGDWQSLGNVEGWYDRESNSIILNPNEGYTTSAMLGTWGLATIIHEAKHLEQGAPLTKYKELEAMQIAINVAINLGGYYGGPSGKPGQQPSPFSRDGRIIALTLSHDPQVINEYSKILYETTFGYWIFYKLLPFDPPSPAP